MTPPKSGAVGELCHGHQDRVLEGLASHLAPWSGMPEEAVASTGVTRCFLLLLSAVEDAGPAAPLVLSCHPVVVAELPSVSLGTGDVVPEHLDPGPWQREMSAHVQVVA